MKIIYLISKYATFFGALIKGLWEHIFCGIFKIFVEDARYLQPNELCGHVEHSLPQSRAKAFLSIFFPSVINGILAFFLCASGFTGIFILKVSAKHAMFWVYAVLLYLGISFLCNIFPLVEDAMNNWSLIYSAKLSEEDKKRNAEIKEKIKARKAFEKERKKLAKESGKAYKPSSNDDIGVIKSQSSIFTKIILFIPSAVLYAGACLEKYAVTFILSIACIIAAIIIL
ncbi:MAG: hypothetical protein IJU45_00350 [Clostridia bacterium]|nr:hypothetical protein [Clostridia bacterium]